METASVPYQRILFVCVNRREPHRACCAHRESEAIAAALKARIKALGFSGAVRVSTSGCQDLCARGPSVMVFPDHVWYYGVAQADVERIAQDAVRGLQPSAPHAGPVSVEPPAPAH